MFIKVNRIVGNEQLEPFFVVASQIVGMRPVAETHSKKAYTVIRGVDAVTYDVTEAPEQIEELILQAKIKEQRDMMIAGRDYFVQELARAQAEKAAEQPEAPAAPAKKPARRR